MKLTHIKRIEEGPQHPEADVDQGPKGDLVITQFRPHLPIPAMMIALDPCQEKALYELLKERQND